jgi:hypothetical protein
VNGGRRTEEVKSMGVKGKKIGRRGARKNTSKPKVD